MELLMQTLSTVLVMNFKRRCTLFQMKFVKMLRIEKRTYSYNDVKTNGCIPETRTRSQIVHGIVCNIMRILEYYCGSRGKNLVTHALFLHERLMSKRANSRRRSGVVQQETINQTGDSKVKGSAVIVGFLHGSWKLVSISNPGTIYYPRRCTGRRPC